MHQVYPEETGQEMVGKFEPAWSLPPPAAKRPPWVDRRQAGACFVPPAGRRGSFRAWRERLAGRTSTDLPNEQGELVRCLAAFAMTSHGWPRRESTVRLHALRTGIADAAAEAGLYLDSDLCWGLRKCALHGSRRTYAIFDWTGIPAVWPGTRPS